DAPPRRAHPLGRSDLPQGDRDGDADRGREEAPSPGDPRRLALERHRLRAGPRLGSADVLARAAIELVGERGGDRQPDAWPVTDELLEAPPRQPPEDDVGRGARGRGPARQEHAELAKMSRRGDPPKGEL